MKDWVVLVLISAFIGTLVPKGKNDTLKKAMAFLMGVILLSMIAAPVVSAKKHLSALPDRLSELVLPEREEMEAEAGNARQWVIRYSVENIEKSVNALLAYRYGLQPDSIETKAITDIDESGNVLLLEIQITVKRETGVLKSEIARYIGDMMACPCVVTLSENIEKGM